MALVKGVKIVKRVLILLLIIAVIFFIFKLVIAGPAIKPIASNAIQLRFEGDQLKKAKIISSTDSLIKKTNNKDVIEQWEKITSCLNEGCEDYQYFNFLIILITDYREEIPNSNLLMNILAVQRYWGTEEVIKFSKAMSFADEEIEKMQNREIKKKWEQAVACNNDCPDKNTLFLKLIQLIINSF